MDYQFNFDWVATYWPVFLAGTWMTIKLIVVGGIVGIAVGIFCAWARSLGPKTLGGIVAVYVELIRNTPFLIQLFFIFFGLPALGLRLTEVQAAMLAMIINLGAYSAEIIRAGDRGHPQGAVRGGGLARHVADSDLPAYRAGTRAAEDLARTCLTGSHRDARFRRGQPDRRGGSDVRGELHPIPHLPGV